MSWSFEAVGKPAAVLDKAKKDLAFKCSQPEESIKAKVLEILSISLSAYPTEYVVQVIASGSQSDVDGDAVNSLFVNIKHMHAFVSAAVSEELAA